MTELENEANASTSSGDNTTSALFSGREVRSEESGAESEKIEKSESVEDAKKSDDIQSEAESKPEGEQIAGEEPEKIVLTKAEKDAEEMKIREIEQRKAKRRAEQEVDARVKQEVENLKQQIPQQQQQQQGYVPPAPSPDHIWDESIRQWVDPNMSLQDYAQLATQTQPQAGYYNQQPPVNQQINQQPAQPQQTPAKSQPQFTEEAMNQADECVVRIKDFKEVLTIAPISPEMANAAALDSNGLNNLYEMAKEPTSAAELYKILQLPVKEQEQRMWMMNQKFADERADKLKSKATPQASPLNNTGEVSKDESNMGVSELKRKRHAKYWDEGG